MNSAVSDVPGTPEGDQLPAVFHDELVAPVQVFVAARTGIVTKHVTREKHINARTGSPVKVALGRPIPTPFVHYTQAPVSQGGLSDTPLQRTQTAACRFHTKTSPPAHADVDAQAVPPTKHTMPNRISTTLTN